VFRLIEAFALSRRPDGASCHRGQGQGTGFARSDWRARSGSRPGCTLRAPRKTWRPWYGAADAFALASLYDPFPNAALEAMACGCL